MALNPGDLLFVGWDSDNDDIAFVTTVDIPEGEVIYFTDDEWDGTGFNRGEQYMEWTVPAGGVPAGTVVTIDMDRVARTATIDTGGTFDYLRGGYDIALRNEMFWAFQGTRDGNFADPTNFIAVIGHRAGGNSNQTPNLDNTGLTPSNGALVIDGNADYLEFTGDDLLADPVVRDDLIAAILDEDNWTAAEGAGNNNPNPGGGFDVEIPDVVCFAAGTLITTPSGPRRVERLAPGDLVDTLDRGPLPLSWCGRQTVPGTGRFAPVLFEAGTIGNARALRVSPQHRILVRGWRAELMFGEIEVLVPAKALINGTTIRRAPVDQIDYIHLMFGAHQIIFAEGAPSESFFPGAQAMSALDQEVRDELFALFPGLREEVTAYGPMARPAISARAGMVLAA